MESYGQQPGVLFWQLNPYGLQLPRLEASFEKHFKVRASRCVSQGVSTRARARARARAGAGARARQDRGFAGAARR